MTSAAPPSTGPAETALPEPLWLATPRGDVITELRAHAIRGDFTLCGMTASKSAWSDPPEGCGRCAECAAVPPGHATYLDMIGLGLTPRKLDYWTRRGLLVLSATSKGSGYRRTWPGSEYLIAKSILRLMAEGYTLRSAAAQARELLAPDQAES
jgi:hypothetical protein